MFREVRRDAGKCRTVSSEDIEEVEEQGVLHVAHVLCPCLLEGCAVNDPSFACEDVSLGVSGQRGN